MMSSQSQSDESEQAIKMSSKVFGPNGFGVVLETDGETALVKPIRSEAYSARIFDLDELEVVDDREWIVYDDGPTETPHR